MGYNCLYTVSTRILLIVYTIISKMSTPKLTVKSQKQIILKKQTLFWKNSLMRLKAYLLHIFYTFFMLFMLFRVAFCTFEIKQKPFDNAVSRHFQRVFRLAEREGFEPSMGLTIHEFQSCAINRARRSLHIGYTLKVLKHYIPPF